MGKNTWQQAWSTNLDLLNHYLCGAFGYKDGPVIKVAGQALRAVVAVFEQDGAGRQAGRGVK